MECRTCKGTGHISAISGMDFIGYFVSVKHCKDCGGTGEEPQTTCVGYGGGGFVNATVINAENTGQACQGHREGAFVNSANICQTCGLPVFESGGGAGGSGGIGEK